MRATWARRPAPSRREGATGPRIGGGFGGGFGGGVIGVEVASEAHRAITGLDRDFWPGCYDSLFYTAQATPSGKTRMVKVMAG